MLKRVQFSFTVSRYEREQCTNVAWQCHGFDHIDISVSSAWWDVKENMQYLRFDFVEKFKWMTDFVGVEDFTKCILGQLNFKYQAEYQILNDTKLSI